MSPRRPAYSSEEEELASRGEASTDLDEEPRDSAEEQAATNLSDRFEDLHFDPSEMADPTDEVRQLRSELELLRSKLTSAQPPGMSDTSMHTAPPLPRRPKIKDVKCSNFTGHELYAGLGCGFEMFVNESEHATVTESKTNGSEWTDELKSLVMANFFEGAPARHYHKKNQEWKRKHNNENMPYDQTKKVMTAKFGCNLNQLELSERRKAQERDGDLWDEYLEYWKHIEGLMEGDQSRLVLDVFCKYACPELSASLRLSVDASNTDYLEEANKVMERLCDLKGDGRRIAGRHDNGNGHRVGGAPNNGPKGRRNGNENGKHRKHRKHRKNKHGQGTRDGDSRQPDDQDGGEAMAAGGQKGNNPATRGLCFVCGKSGHRMLKCPLVGKAKQLATSGAANAAVGSDEGSDADLVDSDDAAHVWMATEKDVEETVDPDKRWLMDSGATHHLSCDRTQLFALEPANLRLNVADGNSVLASERGCAILTTRMNGTSRAILLENVYFVPELSANLISVKALVRRGLQVKFGTQCEVITSSGRCVAIAQASPIDGLWTIDGETGAVNLVSVPDATLQKWHERLGHVNFQDLLLMVDKGLAKGMKASNRRIHFCMSCAEAKETKRGQGPQDTSRSAPTDEIGAVFCVDLKVDLKPDRLGHRHMLTIVEHATSYNRVYLLHKKSQAEDRFVDFVNEFETQFDVKVKVVRSDGGGEFRSNQFLQFLRNRGIRRQLTEPHTSASNGKAERLHRTLMDSGRAMLWASGLKDSFWGDAVLYASAIRNLVPTRANADHSSPLEALTGEVPDVSSIQRFGEKCTVHVQHEAGRSLTKRAEKAFIIGIDGEKKAYKLYIPRTKNIVSSSSIQNIGRLDARSVGRYMDDLDADNAAPYDTINAALDPYSNPQNGAVIPLPDISPSNATSDDEGEPSHVDPTHTISARTIQRLFGLNRCGRALPHDDFKLPTSFLKEFASPAIAFLSITMRDGRAFASISENDGVSEPKTVHEAIKSPYWEQWSAAMQEELRAIASNATWEVVEAPLDGNLISAKWVFELKFNSRGELDRFKARLVARGFDQKYGIDFSETFAPVLKIASLRFIVALAVLWYVFVRHGDVPNAYLRAALDKPILMRPPKELAVPKGNVLLLKKSLQSGRL